MEYCKIYSVLFATLLTACSASKFVPENQYMLESVKIKSDRKDLDASTLSAYVRQTANSKWFSLFKIPLGTYALAGRDSTKWMNRTLKHIGEAPVIFDTVQARLSVQDLTAAMRNMGYMQAQIQLTTTVKGKKIKVVYQLHPREPYLIHALKYDIQDSVIAALLARKDKHDMFKPSLTAGSRFTVDALNAERKNITDFLLNHGY